MQKSLAFACNVESVRIVALQANERLGTILGNLSSQNLTTLSLTRIYGSEQTFNVAILKHATTLKTLELQECGLQQCGCWSRVLTSPLAVVNLALETVKLDTLKSFFEDSAMSTRTSHYWYACRGSLPAVRKMFQDISRLYEALENEQLEEIEWSESDVERSEEEMESEEQVGIEESEEEVEMEESEEEFEASDEETVEVAWSIKERDLAV